MEPAINAEISAFWCRYPSARNFGDALTPWLVRKITGRLPVFTRPDQGKRVHLVAGSVLNFSTQNTTVWGTGILSSSDCVDPAATFRSVRGPLSRKRALECGADCPEIYGDPAFLLPRFYQPTAHAATSLIGIVPHYFDKPKLFAHENTLADCKLIDIQAPIEKVVDDIASCSYILSSSLHGLIAAHAYGVPAMWVEFSKTLLGDGVKFRDYFASIHQPPYEPPMLNPSAMKPADLLDDIPRGKPAIDLEALWEACPFRRRDAEPGHP